MLKSSLLSFAVFMSTAMFLVACEKAPLPFECTDAIGCLHIAPGEPLRLGVIQDRSGAGAVFGLGQIRGVEMVLDDQGRELLGHRVEVLLEDSGCTPEGGSEAATKLATAGNVLGVVGTTCSASAVKASAILSRAGLTMISRTNSAPSLTGIGGTMGGNWHPGYFRTGHNDAQRAHAVALFALERLGLLKASAIDDGDPFSRGLAEIFMQAYSDQGGPVVLHTSIHRGDLDMQPVLESVASSGARLLFLPLFEAEALPILKQARAMPELKGLEIVGAQTLATETFIEKAGADGEGIYIIVGAPAGAATKKLVSRYRDRYEESPASDSFVNGYVAAALLMKAIEKVAVKRKDGLHVGFQAIRDFLYRTEGFEGKGGTLACNQFGDCGNAKFHIVRLEDPSAGLDGLKGNEVFSYPNDR